VAGASTGRSLLQPLGQPLQRAPPAHLLVGLVVVMT
jgi:hypothetical protein